jgi:heat shock protein HslJ
MTEARRLLAVLFVLLTGVGIAACGSDSGSDGDSGNSEVEGVTWTVMNIATQGSATSLPKGVEAPTLEISDGMANIFAGCNSGSGEVELTDTTMDFGPIAMTKKSCDQVQNQIEFLVNKVLQGQVTYEVNADGFLVVERNGDSLVYTPPE